MKSIEIKLLVALVMIMSCGAASAQGTPPGGPSLSPNGKAGSAGLTDSHDPSTNEKKVADDQTFGQSLRLCDRAEEDADSGKWQVAASEYRQALAYWPHNPTALYGLARCAAAAGDTEAEIGYYRTVIYKDLAPPRLRIQESNPDKLLKYVLLLTKDGQTVEAVAVYDYAVGLLNHRDGKEHNLAVDLPVFGNDPEQTAYTLQEFKAMAHLALSVATNDSSVLASNAKDAVRLDPNSAAANYYWGKYLLGRDNAGAKIALQKVVQLGDEQAATAANVYLPLLR